MATIPLWIQLRNRRIRKIEATSLTWVYGTITSGAVLYSASGTSVTIDTFSSVVESAPTSLTTVVDSQSFTVGQEQVAIELPNDQEFQPAQQLSPAILNTTSEVTSANTSQGRNLKAPGAVKQIIGLDVYKYIRFTGTELPAAGVMFARADVVGMFTYEPDPSQL